MIQPIVDGGAQKAFKQKRKEEHQARKSDDRTDHTHSPRRTAAPVVLRKSGEQKGELPEDPEPEKLLPERPLPEELLPERPLPEAPMPEEPLPEEEKTQRTQPQKSTLFSPTGLVFTPTVEPNTPVSIRFRRGIYPTL